MLRQGDQAAMPKCREVQALTCDPSAQATMPGCLVKSGCQGHTSFSSTCLFRTFMTSLLLPFCDLQ
jgi:hypothetical protein